MLDISTHGAGRVTIVVVCDTAASVAAVNLLVAHFSEELVHCHFHLEVLCCLAQNASEHCYLLDEALAASSCDSPFAAATVAYFAMLLRGP